MFHADDESQGVLEGWDDILEKAFAKRFDFDSVELRNLYRNVRIKRNSRCPVG
jgi:hypothetical protein